MDGAARVAFGDIAASRTSATIPATTAPAPSTNHGARLRPERGNSSGTTATARIKGVVDETERAPLGRSFLAAIARVLAVSCRAGCEGSELSAAGSFSVVRCRTGVDEPDAVTDIAPGIGAGVSCRIGRSAARKSSADATRSSTRRVRHRETSSSTRGSTPGTRSDTRGIGEFRISDTTTYGVSP